MFYLCVLMYISSHAPLLYTIFFLFTYEVFLYENLNMFVHKQLFISVNIHVNKCFFTRSYLNSKFCEFCLCEYCFHLVSLFVYMNVCSFHLICGNVTFKNKSLKVGMYICCFQSTVFLCGFEDIF